MIRVNKLVRSKSINTHDQDQLSSETFFFINYFLIIVNEINNLITHANKYITNGNAFHVLLTDESIMT